MSKQKLLAPLRAEFEGEVYTSEVYRALYATDASSYREKPLAVVLPRNRKDIKRVIAFAVKNSISLIPRAAGTSLAGQVVGAGIVVDVSKYLTQVLEFNKKEGWVRVEPGVNPAELNLFLKPYGLQFGPETSTSNYCCIGGMLGNNSCGLHSLIYGSVRDHVLEVETILSDGSEATFNTLSKEEFNDKCKGSPELLETQIYRQIKEALSSPAIRKKIEEVYPESSVSRRNMGYAVDALMNTKPFISEGGGFNFSKLLAGSEGTLAFTTAMKLNLIPLPPKVKAVIPAHFSSLDEAMRANIIILKHNPGAIELMDNTIMECTKDSIGQRKNRFFIKDNPQAILMIEFARESEEEIIAIHKAMVSDMQENGYGYHFPLILDREKIKRVWELRKAGLGLLSNIPGDKRSTTVVEDTAVAPNRLPEYINDFRQVLKRHNLNCVYYGHIATGELHLRPLLNLKNGEDRRLYSTIAVEIAKLVKEYRGSLSGEHGDGRLRGPFIPYMFGETIYELFKEIKSTWDPKSNFNPGKITNAPPITENLRFDSVNGYTDIKTVSTFSSTYELVRAVERCSGAGNCRKSMIIGGAMCPTYMATRDEDKSTRGRANVLREFLYYPLKRDRLQHEDVYRVLNLCISCKSCRSECPSNVDISKLKSEFLQYYYSIYGIPFRTRMVAFLPRLSPIAKKLYPLSNALIKSKWFKKIIGFTPKRSIPRYARQSVIEWYNRRSSIGRGKRKVYVFADEFINYQEPDIGVKTILLLEKLGYEAVIPKHRESARTFISKGLVKEAKRAAIKNVRLLKDIVSEQTPIIGIEPSAILSFRDEYPELVGESEQEAANELAQNALLFEEFFIRETERGNICSEQFSDKERVIRLHGHCQQKAVASVVPTIKMLSFPKNYYVKEVDSGCCGMAGSFGYEKEHYELSMKIGNMVLFPEIEKTAKETIIAAPGTGCRHHILDGTGRKAVHPIEIMYDAIR